MSTITVKVNDQAATIAEHTVATETGTPTIIQAADRTNYEFLDQATGYAPDDLITKRINNDLHVSFANEGLDPHLIVEDFYDTTDSALMGIAEDGNYYQYVPDTGEVTDYVTELEPGEIQGHALGGSQQVAPWWVGAAENSGFNALAGLAGLAGSGVAASALSNGNNDDN